MIALIRAYLHRRRLAQAEAKALRDVEHARAIRAECARQFSEAYPTFSVEPSLPSQQLAAEIEELRSGRVSTAFSRRVAAKNHQCKNSSAQPKNGHKA